ncbi:FAD-binding oxidoreductase [Streptomyces sp. NPDC004111]|uniref:FAD-binding oxidoreductase n=1 Tax=Streptomyces sp. NPDC004111 TaxID=3364690 RepID=UPI0036A36B77
MSLTRRTLLTATATAATAAATATGCRSERPAAPPASSPPTPPATKPRPPSPPATRRPHDWAALARTLEGTLLRPEDADYASAARLYNTRFDHLRPAALAHVAHEADVREVLGYARATGTPVAVRNGGHSYAGWSSGTGRLVIDVSALATVGTPAAGTATVGAGAKLIDVYRSLGAAGRTVPAGSCPTVGISGLTLGGGHGVVSRAYGLTCDSLTAATLVTADGRTLRCDASRNTDLFWALRGAGNGQFGVVTGLEFRTHPAPRAVTGYLGWPWSKAAAVLGAWQEWGPDQPDEIWSSAHFSAGAAGGDPTVSLAVFSLGTRGDLADAVDRLAAKAGAPPRSVSLIPRGYQESMLLYAGCADLSEAQCHLPGRTPGRTPEGALGRETYDSRSDFFARSLNPAGIRTLLSGVEDFTRIGAAQGGGGGTVTLTALGGAVNRVAPGATAFVHRDMRMLAQYTASWRPGTPGTAQRNWLARTHGAMRRHASGSAYQNYTDPTLTDWRRAYFGSAAARLTALKSRYDPDRVFDFPQAL